MSEAESETARPRPLGQPVEVRIAATLDSLAVVRTVVTALTTMEDLDLDAVADLRLAVDEACTRLIRCAAVDAVLMVKIEPHDRELVITASAPCVADDVLRPGTFSWHVISSLTDDVQIFRDGVEVDDKGRVFGITMTARRLEPNW
ncbi:MAG: ATP-binding protein [Mycobacteriaceae bacterium]|nr:ATP-binding protein [Mycobacteriaceae bacterium]